MNDVIIELKDLVLEYEGERVVNGINLQIYKNEFVTILGPSGCGKTSTLRMIGGFAKPTSGDVIINGEIVNELPPYARPTNTVFQRYALFPHLNVLENIKIGLNSMSYNRLQDFFGDDVIKNELSRLNLKETTLNYRKAINSLIDTEARKQLKMVKLEGLENRKIDQMSGGQQQRVAIARAIINRPEILLLDEPLAALDLKLRENMQYELKEMQKKLGITFIYVTHDQNEAMTMSDRIIVMNNGDIQQLGNPQDIYNTPVNKFVAGFIGEANIIRGKYLKDSKVEILGGVFDCPKYDYLDNEEVDVVIHDEDMIIVPVEKGRLVATVTSCIFKGVYYEICCLVNGIEIEIHQYVEVEVGSRIGLSADFSYIHLMKVS